MKISKLKYPNKETAIADLLAKGVYIESEEGLVYGQGTHAIVELGLIVDVEGTYDDEGEELTAPVLADGYHFDVMTENEIDFENAIEPENPRHTFL
jgi:hypothetical protein